MSLRMLKPACAKGNTSPGPDGTPLCLYQRNSGTCARCWRASHCHHGGEVWQVCKQRHGPPLSIDAFCRDGGNGKNCSVVGVDNVRFSTGIEHLVVQIVTCMLQIISSRSHNARSKQTPGARGQSHQWLRLRGRAVSSQWTAKYVLSPVNF